MQIPVAWYTHTLVALLRITAAIHEATMVVVARNGAESLAAVTQGQARRYQIWVRTSGDFGKAKGALNA